MRLSLDEIVHVKMKNDRILEGKLHAFDQHLNLVMGNVKETIYSVNDDLSVSIAEKKHSLMFIRGDKVILIAPIK